MKVKKDFIQKVIAKEVYEGLQTETPKYIYRANYYGTLGKTSCYEIIRYINLRETYLRAEFSEVIGIFTTSGNKITID